jgi:non-specific serine/threonine protein kinase
LAGLAFEWTISERAVELLGASQAALEELDAPLAPADAADFARDQARGKASLSPAAWEAAMQRGRALGLLEALALAQGPSAGQASVDAGLGTVTPAGKLSPREREVVALIARGLSNREIAATLVISEKTAANHVEHIMTKLDLRSRAQVAVWAVRHGTG